MSETKRMPTGEEGPQPEPGDEILFGGKTKGWYRWAAWFAGMCFRSRMLPSHIQNQEQALYILLKGEELGLKPTFAWDYLYPTKSGKLGIPKRAALAVVQSKPTFGGYEERLEGDGETLRGVAIATRKGFPPTLKAFGMADAKEAGLLQKPRTREGREYEGPWQAYLKDMLLARAAGRALNVAFAAELAGCLVEGEAEDADEMEGRKRAAGQRQLPAGAPPRRDPLLEAIASPPKALPAATAPSGEPVVLDPALVKVISDQVWPKDMVAFVNPDGTVAGVITNVGSGPPPAAQPPAATQAVPPRPPDPRHPSGGKAKARSGGGGGSTAPAGDRSAPMKRKETSPAGDTGPGFPCPRCKGMALNALGGCDICAYPGADIR